MKIIIQKYNLEPEGVVAVPEGAVLLVGFDGEAAYAWVQHQENEVNAMHLLCLPTGIADLDTDERFWPALHVGSFFKNVYSGIHVSKGTPKPKGTSAWHVFAWHLKPDIAALAQPMGEA